jgi:plastocyanin
MTVGAVAFVLALLVPSGPLVAQEAPSGGPVAAVTASEAAGTVAFDASSSTGRIVDYQWDLNGDSVYETDTGAQSSVERRYPAGTAVVASVRVTDDAGATADATTTVAVAARARPAPEVATASETAQPTVRAAAAGSVTIKDFAFAPSSLTIGVGDTVTWTNSGPSIHTATAKDGSFDSGNLDKGQSYSKTFSSAGTYSYICRPHPFMTGKIVVTAAGASGGGSNSGGGSSGSGTGAGSGTGTGSGTGSASGLPNTGIDVIPWSLFGFSLFAFGAALRFRLRTE